MPVGQQHIIVYIFISVLNNIKMCMHVFIYIAGGVVQQLHALETSVSRQTNSASIV
jgi:hypothetical protein